MADRKTLSGVDFLDLPWEDVVFSHIFKYLKISQIFNCRRVSKTFKKLCQNYFDSCRILNCSELGSRGKTVLVPAKAFKLMVQNNTSLQQLTLKGCKDTVNDGIIVDVLRRSPRLLSLDLSGLLHLTNLVLFVIAENCQNLKKISLAGCRWVSTDGIIRLSLCCTSLEYIDISGCWEITDYCVTSLASFCNNLKFISVSGCYGITDNGLRAISRSCPFLMHLGVSGCWRVSDDAIRAIGEYCSELKSLQVKDCRDVTEASLARLRLREIEIDVMKPPTHGMPLIGNVRIARVGNEFVPYLPVINLNI